MPGGPSFFDGLADDDLRWILDKLERREFAAGDTMLAEGDAPAEIYIIEEGDADVLMSDDRGVEHRLNRVGAGATLGEMSMFTSRPISATVRAVSDCTVLVLGKTDFQRVGSMFPRVYENLGAVLSERLADADRRLVRGAQMRVTVVLDAGGPPLAAYALAASVAWHTGESALLVLGPDVRRDAALDALEEAEPPPGAGEGELEPRAYVVDAGGRSVPRLLADHTGFGHVVVLMREGGLPPNHVDRTVRLVAAHEGGGGADADYAVRAFVDGAARSNRHRDGIVDVPPLGPADETALREGLLPASTPAGTALGSVARDAADIEVGVALGGGAIRGWAHIGVLDALGRAGVPVDYVAGTSIGAIVAAAYSTGMTIEEITEALYRTSARIFKMTVPRNALLSPSGLRAGLQQTLRETLIEDLVVPCAITATDILAQREVVLRTGLLWEAVLASASIPGVWPPQRIGPYLLVDGGVLNPVPSNVVADMGASIQIGIKLTRSMTRSKARGDRAPRLIDMLTSTFELMQSKISTDTAAASTLLIEPTFDDSAGFGLRGFHEGRRYIPNGEDAVEAALPRLAAVLPWLRRREAIVAH